MAHRAPETLVEGWRKAYMEWRIVHEADLDAIAGAVAERVHDEHVWQLINDLMESAVHTGWQARSADGNHSAR